MFVSRLLSAKESDKLNKGTISSLNLSFLQPSWWAKPASWAVLRLFWIMCVCIYIIYIYICMYTLNFLTIGCI